MNSHICHDAVLFFFYDVDWQLMNILLIVKELERRHCDVTIFIFSSKDSVFLDCKNSEKFLGLKKYNTIYFNDLRDLQEKIQKIKDELYGKNNTDFFVILNKDRGAVASSIVNLCNIFSMKLILLQHGEGWWSDYDFTWKYGWIGLYSIHHKIVKAVKQVALQKFFNVGRLFKVDTNILNVNSLDFSYKNSEDIISIADKVFVINTVSLSYITRIRAKCGKEHTAFVIGSFAYERALIAQNKFKSNAKNVETNAFLIYSVGAYKGNNHKLKRYQTLVFNHLALAARAIGYKVFVKLKTGEMDCWNSENINRNPNLFLYNNSDAEPMSYIPILPIDSTACIDYLTSKKLYVVYQYFDNIGQVGVINQKYNRRNVFHKHVSLSLTQDSLLEAISMSKYELVDSNSQLVELCNVNKKLASEKFVDALFE